MLDKAWNTDQCVLYMCVYALGKGSSGNEAKKKITREISRMIKCFMSRL